MNKKKKTIKGNSSFSLWPFLNMMFTFTLVMLTFIIFRSNSIASAFQFYKKMCSFSMFSIPNFNDSFLLSLIFMMLTIEWINRDKEHGFQIDYFKPIVKWSFYYLVVLTTFYYFLSADIKQEFLYFQF